MHEMSLARALLGQVAELAAVHGGGAVREVRVQLGPISGVEPVLLAAAFDRLRSGAAVGSAALSIEEVSLAARCGACGAEFEPLKFRFHCPTCGSGETDVVRGDGVILHSIVMEDAEQGAVS